MEVMIIFTYHDVYPSKVTSKVRETIGRDFISHIKNRVEQKWRQV